MTGTLPGARVLPTTGRAAEVWKMMLSFNPAGLIEIDPGLVVANAKVARFETLPQAAGLAHYVESGALEVTGSLRGYRVVEGAGTIAIQNGRVRTPEGMRLQEITTPNEFTIRKAITFPTGLNGAHSVRFVLPSGVPEPKGDRGHSELIRLR